MEQPSKNIQLHRCSHGIFGRIPKDLWRLLLLKIGRAKTFVRLYHCCRLLKQLALKMSARLLEMAEALRVKESYAMALQQLVKSALTRNHRAMFHIGMAFQDGGWTLERNYVKSNHWLYRTAQIGSCAATVNLHAYRGKVKVLLGDDNYAKGIFYIQQADGNIDVLKTALTCLLCAAATGDEYAMYEIWNLDKDLIRHLNDSITTQDIETYLFASAKKGYAKAQYQLAKYLFHTKGDKSLGETWMIRAAAQRIEPLW